VFRANSLRNEDKDIVSFFHLDTIPNKNIFQPHLNFTQQLAWLGDSLLQLIVTMEILSRNKSASTGELTMERLPYISNCSMAAFIKNNEWISKESPLNNQNCGTIFEALLALCHESNGNNFSITSHCVREFMKWIDDNIGNILQTTKKESRSLNNNGNPAALLKYTTKIDEMIEEIFKKKEEQKKLQIERERSVLRNQFITQNVPEYWCDYLQKISNRSVNDSSHSGNKVEVEWTSRQGHKWKSDFWDCCGQFVGDSVHCMRYSWVDQNSIHTGEMIIGGSRKSGGGRSPGGTTNDYIPRPHQPIWSCCGELSISEGCRSLD